MDPCIFLIMPPPDSAPEPPPDPENSQILNGDYAYHEIMKAVERVRQESNSSAFLILGALEAVKFNICEELRRLGNE